MNPSLIIDEIDLWHVAAWTMVHFLWLGTLAALAAAVGRLLLRRAPASVRYAAALACLAVVAAMPIGIAAWLIAQPDALRVASVANEPFAPATHAAELREPIAEPPVVARSVAPVPASPTTPVEQPNLAPIGAIPPSTTNSPFVVFASQQLVSYLPWLWLLGTPLTFLLLTTGIVGAERLRRTSRVLEDGPIVDACKRLADALRLGRRVTVAVCERIATPVLVGIVRPIILLPPSALTGWSPDEIEMVLLHELAHVRRWDNLVNLVQRIVESLLFFHPAVWLVSTWVRREREACCDAVVVNRTQQPHAYAELLVEFAARRSEFSEPERGHRREALVCPRSNVFTQGRRRPSSLVGSAMAAGPLRSRIRRILQLEDDPMLVSGKSLALVMSGLLLAATLTVLNLPTHTQAEESTTEGAENSAVDVAFVEGASRFEEGDSINITKVRGTLRTFEPGNTYWIEGTYTLASRERATLLASVTARNVGDGRTSNDKDQTMIVKRGSGEFTLKLPMRYDGWPHVSYYPADGGEGFGGVYFGTGDSVLKKWWGETEDTDSTAADAKQRSMDVTKHTKKETSSNGDVSELQAQQYASQNNLKSLALAVLNYEAAMRRFPPMAQFDTNGKPLLSWRVLVLPFLGESEAKLYEEFHLNESWDSEHNRKLVARMPKVFQNPRIDRPGVTNYLSVVGKECMFDEKGKPVQLKHVTDGTAHTIAIVEANSDLAVEWTKPQDWEFDRENPTAGLGGLWPDCWLAAWVDGRALPVSNDESPDRVGIQFTRAGGETNSLRESAGRAAHRTETGMGGEFGMGMERGMMGSRGGEIGGRGFGREMGMARGGFAGGGEGMAGGGYGGQLASDPMLNAPAKKFPSLEDQKLADVVYRRLGLELEPLAEDDLRRVRALGYDGGVKVTQNDGRVIRVDSIRPNDILLGLHVWPTTSAADVVTVLDRQDLAELDPLKFYVIRRQGDGDGSMGGRGGYGSGGYGRAMGMSDAEPGHDVVITGRISVNLQKSSPSASPYGRSTVAPTPIPSDALKDPHSATAPDNGLEQALQADPNLLMKYQELFTLQSQLSDWMGRTRSDVTDAKSDRLKQQIEAKKRAIDEYRNQLRRQKADTPESDRYEAASPTRTRQQSAAVLPDSAQRTAADAPRSAMGMSPTPTRPQHPAPLTPQTYQPPAEIARPQSDPIKPRPSVAEPAPQPKTPRGRASQPAEQKAPAAAVEQSAPRYQGESFEYWRDLLRNELSDKQRLQAALAVRAFGRGGYGAQAAEAIVEAAGQYDWPPAPWPEANQLNSVQQACISTFVKSPFASYAGGRLEFADAWPALAQAGESSHRGKKMFLTHVLPFAEDGRAVELLVQLTRDEDAHVRDAALLSLYYVRSLPESEKPALIERVLAALRGKNSNERKAAVMLLNAQASRVGGFDLNLGEADPLIAALSHTDWIAKLGREALRTAAAPEAATSLMHLSSYLQTYEQRPEFRIPAIRAVAALGPSAREALQPVAHHLKSSDPQERIAAAAAIKMIVGKDQYQKPIADVLGEQLGIKAVETDTGAWAVLPRDDAADADAFNEFTDAVIKEQQSLFMPDANESGN